jgi:hypothetical protein
MRYTAPEALKHPWITRINKSGIPQTMEDQVSRINTEKSLRSKLATVFFLSTQATNLDINLGNCGEKYDID